MQNLSQRKCCIFWCSCSKKRSCLEIACSMSFANRKSNIMICNVSLKRFLQLQCLFQQELMDLDLVKAKIHSSAIDQCCLFSSFDCQWVSDVSAKVQVLQDFCIRICSTMLESSRCSMESNCVGLPAAEGCSLICFSTKILVTSRKHVILFETVNTSYCFGETWCLNI